MRRGKRNSIFLVILALGLGLPGLMGIFAVQAQVVDDRSNSAWVAFQNDVTSTPTLTNTPLPSPTSTGLPSISASSPYGSSTISVYAFIQVPAGYVAQPYVILTSFASLASVESVVLRGYVDTVEFICTDSPCIVYLDGGARVVFRAFTNSGESSEEVIASVSVAKDDLGYQVSLDSVSQFTSFVDACSVAWSIKDDENASWDSFSQFPYQLNTNKTLHNLARQLILNGVVDVSQCPYGGLNDTLDWPTACGLEAASEEMLTWQNQYDEYIWLASKDQGMPPKVMKTLIEVESQFWPGNSRFYLDEYGLGQINQLGVDVLLRKDPTVYQRICPTVLLDCSVPYISLEPSQQALIRGAVVQSVDATCPTCDYGLNLDVAKDSVALIASLLRANCSQVKDILGTRISDADYEDMWRFTFATYHGGMSCFQNAVTTVKKGDDKLTWENIEGELKCKGTDNYVNGLMGNLFSFDKYLYTGNIPVESAVTPVAIPTRTPIATPTVYISTAVVKVQVYMDRNGNGSPDADEWIDGMSVLLKTTSNEEITQRTEKGVAVFDMTGYPPGIGIDVSLPGLYRSEDFTLPQQGEVVITFSFDQPTLPTILP